MAQSYWLGLLFFFFMKKTVLSQLTMKYFGPPLGALFKLKSIWDDVLGKKMELKLVEDVFFFFNKVEDVFIQRWWVHLNPKYSFQPTNLLPIIFFFLISEGVRTS